jgi:cardiolipin synthase
MTEVWWAVWGVSAVACLFFAVEILRSRRREQTIAAWLLLFLLTPPLGALLYLVFGSRKLRRRVARKGRMRAYLSEAAGSPAPVCPVDRVIRSHGLPGPTGGNRVRLHGTPNGSYAAVIDTIAGARERLWAATYILGSDAVAREILSRLAERAAAGVQVRLLIDDVGSGGFGSGRVRDRDLAPLLEAGGRVARFMPVTFLPKPRSYANLRNHRKLIVADGGLAWSGGMNLAELYLGPATLEGRFRDLSFTIEGPAAAVYADVFAADWHYTTGEPLPLDRVRSADLARAPGDGVVQVVPSGPEMRGDPLYDVLLTLVNAAERRIWAVTPYFVPDRGLLRAFTLAARRGVDVRVVVPRVSDHWLLDVANVPYLRSVAAVGGRALRLRSGMLHAKALVVDDRAIAGTANLDQRSLFLNHEIMALLHGREDSRAVAEWVEAQFRDCDEHLPAATPVRQVLEGTVRLFSPVL